MAKSFSSVNQAEKAGVQNANLSSASTAKNNTGSSYTSVNQAEKAGVKNANLKVNAALDRYRIKTPSTPNADSSAFGSLAKDRRISGLSLVTNKDTLKQISEPKKETESHADDNFFQRLWNTVKGGGKGSAAGYTNAMTTLADLMRNASAYQITPQQVAVQTLTGDNSKASAIENVANANKGVMFNAESDKKMSDLYSTADKLATESATDIENAKEGNSKLGNLAVDVGVAGTQLLGDSALNALAPGASLVGLGLRSFGGAAQEARNEGANQAEQLGYGTLKAGIEVATEKLTDVAKFYGGDGLADKVIDNLIGRINSNFGKGAAKTAIAMLGEAGEEVISDIFDPFVKGITYDNGEAIKKLGTEEGMADYLGGMAYDALIGGILGGLGGAGQVIFDKTGKSNTPTTPADAELGADANNVKGKAPVNPAIDIAQNKASQTDAQTNPTTDTSVAESPDIGQPREFISEPVIAPTVDANPTADVAPTEADVQPTAEESKPYNPLDNRTETHSGDMDTSKATAFEKTLTEEEKQMEGLGSVEYEVRHDAQVDEESAQLLEADKEGTKDALMQKESWDDTETNTMRILMEEQLDAVRTSDDPKGALEELAKMRAKWNEEGRDTARSLRQRSRFGGTRADVVSDAACILTENANNLKPSARSEEAKARIIKDIDTYEGRLESLEPTDSAGLIQLIKDVSKARRTTGLFGKDSGVMIDWALNQVAQMDGGMEFLRNLATTQIRSIAGDYVKVKPLDAIKAITYQNALSNPRTSSRNVTANTVFGEFLSNAANNLALPFDMLVSAITGKRGVAFDAGLLSGRTWTGAYEAGLKSFLEVSLDAEADQSTYAYGEIKGSTFKMIGNPVERFFATVGKWQGYAMKTTDQVAKGGVEKEIAGGLNALKAKGADVVDAETAAKDEAKYRTLQSENKVTKATTEVKNIANKLLGIGNEKTGRIGLGDRLLMFAQVPANSVVTTLEMRPSVGTALAFRDILNLAINPTAENQRQATLQIGRTVTGAAMVGVAALMSGKGLLRHNDDEDEDYTALEKAMGKSGLQFNLDGTLRMFSGGNTTPQAGDRWISIGYIPQLNSLMITGDELYKSYVDDGRIDPSEFFMAEWTGLIDSIAEFPAVSSITSLIDSAKYAKYEGDDRAELSDEEVAFKDKVEKAKALFGQQLGNDISGLITPNAFRGIAAGIDDTERSTYAGDTPFEQAENYVKGGIPFVRQYGVPALGIEGVPEKLDGFGNPIKNSGGWDQFANKTIRPGEITTDRATPAQKFVSDLYTETGDAGVVPDKNGPSSLSFGSGDDKKTIFLSTDESREYQTVRGQLYEGLINQFRVSEGIDGLDAATKAEVAKNMYAYADAAARAKFAADKGIEGFTNKYTDLVDGTDGKVKVSGKNLSEYLAYETMFKNASKEGKENYEAIDGVINSLGNMTKDVASALIERNDTLKKYKRYADGGIDSALYARAQKSLGEVQSELDTDSKNSRIMYESILKMKATDSEKDKLLRFSYVEDGDTKAYVPAKAWRNAYAILTGHGANAEEVYKFLVDADGTSVYDSDTKTYDHTNKTANNQFSPAEIWAELLRTKGISDDERIEIFNEFVKASGDSASRYDSWSTRASGNWYNKYTWEDANKEVKKNPQKYGNGKYNMVLGITSR